MEASDKQDFAVTIAAMFSTFGQEATKDIMHGYWIGLCDLDLIEVQSAVARAIRELSKLPKPSELRRLTGRLVNAEDLAIAAWGDVLKAVTKGPYKHIDFQDKLCNAVIRNLGGWPSFLSRFTSQENEKWARYDFVKTYCSFKNSGVNGEAIAALPGLAEVTCIGGEVVPSVPVLIGCDETRKETPKLIRSVVNRAPQIRIERQTEPDEVY